MTLSINSSSSSSSGSRVSGCLWPRSMTTSRWLHCLLPHGTQQITLSVIHHHCYDYMTWVSAVHVTRQGCRSVVRTTAYRARGILICFTVWLYRIQYYRTLLLIINASNEKFVFRVTRIPQSRGQVDSSTQQTVCRYNWEKRSKTSLLRSIKCTEITHIPTLHRLYIHSQNNTHSHPH